MVHYASPTSFSRLSRLILPLLSIAGATLFVIGLRYALYLSPPDYQQGEMVRIMYVHVPSAWMALGAYLAMGISSGVYLVWKHRMADVIAHEIAPLGTGFTVICLLTGMLWGKPMWGAYWVWDARLTSMLVLLFLYIGYMALASTLAHDERGRAACAILALVGLANLPIIHFSVEWWNTLHQPSSILRAGGSAIHDPAMETALFSMSGGFACLFGVMLLIRVRTVLSRKKLRRLQLGAL